MIRRELAKDPKLATESWDRFLPNFRKNHLKTSEKTAKKNEKLEAKNTARVAAGLPPESSSDVAAKKKVYTPFPPAQLPRKVRRTSIWADWLRNVTSRSIYNSSLESIFSRKTKRTRKSLLSGNKSRQKQQKNVVQSVQKHLLHQQRTRRRLWKRRDTASGKLWRRKRVQKSRRKNRSTRHWRSSDTVHLALATRVTL